MKIVAPKAAVAVQCHKLCKLVSNQSKTPQLLNVNFTTVLVSIIECLRLQCRLVAYSKLYRCWSSHQVCEFVNLICACCILKVQLTIVHLHNMVAFFAQGVMIRICKR